MDKILHQLIGSLSHYLQGFIPPRRCRISPINSYDQPWKLLGSGFALVAKALLTARADANAVSQAMGKMGIEMGLVMFGV